MNKNSKSFDNLTIDPNYSKAARKIRSGSIIDKTWSPLIQQSRKDGSIAFELPTSSSIVNDLGQSKIGSANILRRTTLCSTDIQSQLRKQNFQSLTICELNESEEKTTDQSTESTSNDNHKSDLSNSIENNLLGGLQPEYYNKVPSKHHYGSICFSLLYDGAVETLTVKIIKAKQLFSRPTSKDSNRNVFVRIFLLPDEENCQQTKTCLQTVNPAFNQEFSFYTSYSNLHHKTLRLSVYEEGQKKSSGILLGHALASLDEIDLSKANHEIWKDLDYISRPGENDFHCGSIQVALSFSPNSGKVNVFVIELKDVKLLKTNATSIYVRLTVFQNEISVKTKKTATKPIASDVTFNEALMIAIDRAHMEQTALRISVIARKSSDGSHHKVTGLLKSIRKQENEPDCECGHVIIGRSTHSEYCDVHFWEETTTHPGRSITKWLALVENSSL